MWQQIECQDREPRIKSVAHFFPTQIKLDKYLQILIEKQKCERIIIDLYFIYCQFLGVIFCCTFNSISLATTCSSVSSWRNVTWHFITSHFSWESRITSNPINWEDVESFANIVSCRFMSFHVISFFHFVIFVTFVTFESLTTKKITAYQGNPFLYATLVSKKCKSKVHTNLNKNILSILLLHQSLIQWNYFLWTQWVAKLLIKWFYYTFILLLLL